jgi:predicted DNA-binding transcriptional regulator AlpA
MEGKRVTNYKGLKAQFGLIYSRTHIMRLMKAGRFPRGFKLGDYEGSPLVWWVHEVEEWLEGRAKTIVV